MGLVIGVVALASGAVSASRHIRRAVDAARLRASIARQYPIGAQAVFKGRYLSHPETARFEWRPDGLDTTVWCQLEYVSGVDRASVTGPIGDEIFDIEFDGKLLERGRFGDKGMSDYRVEVAGMLSAELAEPASP